MKILITGGAGFIGSRLTAKMTQLGHEVTVLDNLSEQIHGSEPEFAKKLTNIANCVEGDVCDGTLLANLVKGKNVIIHLAAETGTGQSMYAVNHYAKVNLQGTASLLDILVNQRSSDLGKIIVASSRAVYGEGQYHCRTHKTVYPAARSLVQMEGGRYDPLCPYCGSACSVEATAESAPFSPSSFYGLTKQMQEQMVLMFANALGIDGMAMRYQNVYGPGQSLNNPYTGILAVFTNLIREGKCVNIFEDGLESRDFVYIDDVVEATAACASPDVSGVHSVNVGSGVRTSVLQVAESIIEYFRSSSEINISGDFRIGDIRHNFADTSKLKSLIGYHPKWDFSSGLKEFLKWAGNFSASSAGYEISLKELSASGMMRAKE